MLEQTTLRVLVCSVHLRGVVWDAAARSTHAVPYVVWVEDNPEAYAMQGGSLPSAMQAGSFPGVMPGAPRTCPGESSATACPEAWSATLMTPWEAVVERGAALPLVTVERVCSATPGKVLKLLPSSGSTGLPKLIVVTEGAPPKPRGAHAAAAPPIVYAYEALRQSLDVVVQGGAIGFFSGSLERYDCGTCPDLYLDLT